MKDFYLKPKFFETIKTYTKDQFVKDVILIIDYDSELQMGGLDEVINGNLERIVSSSK